jgi:hypothetical protein
MLRTLLAAAWLQETLGAYSSFNPGKVWLDTDGNTIRAHSAGLIEHESVYYWYGADNYTNQDGSNRAINVYKSTDLYNWENKGAAFVFDCAEANATKCYADRPKVIFNPSTKRFVMWMKSTPWTAVATANDPTGPFKFKSRFYPNGETNGDPTAFVDPLHPGDAYWIYSIKPGTEKREVRISKMTPDWTGLTGFKSISSTIHEGDEAPAAFYAAGQYFIWTSHCSGWSPNAAILHSAPNLASNWTDLGNPTANKTSFSSQSTYILQIKPNRFIYIADRFEPYIKTPESGRYVWLPLEVDDNGTVTVKWHDEWTLADL